MYTKPWLLFPAEWNSHRASRVGLPGGGRKIRSASSGSVTQQVQVLGQLGLHKTLPQTKIQTQPRLLHVTHGLSGKQTTLTQVIDAEATLAINVI